MAQVLALVALWYRTNASGCATECIMSLNGCDIWLRTLERELDRLAAACFCVPTQAGSHVACNDCAAWDAWADIALHQVCCAQVTGQTPAFTAHLTWLPQFLQVA